MYNIGFKCFCIINANKSLIRQIIRSYDNTPKAVMDISDDYNVTTNLSKYKNQTLCIFNLPDIYGKVN